MANFAPFFAPSKDTIEGINARTGMNLPDLPYGGILSLLTGGASGLGQYALGQILEQNAPKLVSAVDPTVGRGLRNAGDVLQGDLQDYRDTMLDKIFGAVPQTGPAGPTGISTYPQTGWEGNVYDPNSMQNYGINIDQFPNPAFDMPSFDTPDFGQFNFEDNMPNFDFGNFETPVYDFGDFNAPSFGGYEAPVYDFGDFDFRRGGKV
jgi:hypothetical protein